MPRNPTYPLTPVREHRDRKVDAATAELGEAVRAREAAEERKHAAERERLEAAEKAATLRQTEASRLARGELRAADLARAQTWERGADVELTALASAVARADVLLEETRAAEHAARAALAATKADADVVAKDQARFEASARHARNAVEEEASEDLFQSRVAADVQRKA